MAGDKRRPGYGAEIDEQYWESAKSLSRKLAGMSSELDDRERRLLSQAMLELFLSMQETEGVGLLINRNVEEVRGDYIRHLESRDPDAAGEAEGNADFWTPLETTASKQT